MKKKIIIILIVVVALLGIGTGVFLFMRGSGDGKPLNSQNITINVLIAQKAKETTYNIDTVEKYLGDALFEEDLIEFDETEFGRFIHTVDGVKADEQEQQWWQIDVNGQSIIEGVDSVEISEGDIIDITLITGW